MIRSFFIFILFSVLNVTYGQSKTIDMRKLAESKDYGERTILLKDSSSQVKLYQDIWYNKKGVIDEEFSHTLTFLIYDTVLAKKKQTINYSDTTIVKISYDLVSVWNWEPENCIMTGDFEIIELSAQKATIRENITVNDIHNNRTFHFNGVKTYELNPDWN